MLHSTAIMVVGEVVFSDMASEPSGKTDTGLTNEKHTVQLELIRYFDARMTEIVFSCKRVAPLMRQTEKITGSVLENDENDARAILRQRLRRGIQSGVDSWILGK